MGRPPSISRSHENYTVSGAWLTAIGAGGGTMVTSGLASQPSALAPSTAASASLSSLSSMRTLPLNIGIMFFSMALRRGRSRSSPLLANPPNRIMASGDENTVKSANASPSRVPV